MKKENISQEEVRQAVRKISASEGFGRSERLKSLLEYIVLETLEGRAKNLKAFSIGLDVFSIGPDADPEKVAKVRVEMGRLRNKLEHYFLTTGANDPVRVEIPKGNYQPVITKQHPIAHPPTGNMDNKWMVSVGILITLAFVFFAANYFSGTSPFLQKKSAPKPPIVEISVFENYSNQRKMNHVAAGLSFDIVTELARFSWLAVYVSRKKKRGAETRNYGPHKSDYILSGSVNITNDRIIVAYRLNETISGLVKWSKTYDRSLTVDDIYEIQRKTAAAIAIEIGRPQGVVKKLEQAKYREKPTTVSTYICTLLIYQYWQTFSSEDHFQTRSCLEKANQKDPGYAESQAALSFLYLDEVRYEYNTRQGYNPLERSLSLAQRAVEIDPFSTLAKQALFTIKNYTKEFDDFEKYGSQAVALAPNNPELLADYGNKLALRMAKWNKGLALVEHAISLNADPAPWYFIALAYKAILEKDYKKALQWTEKMDAPNMLHYNVVRIISFAEQKNRIKLRQAIKNLPKTGATTQADLIRKIDSWGGHKSLDLPLKSQINKAFLYSKSLP